MNIKTSFTDFVKYEILNFSWKEDDKKNLIISFLYFSKKNLTDDKLLAKISLKLRHYLYPFAFKVSHAIVV